MAAKVTKKQIERVALLNDAILASEIYHDKMVGNVFMYVFNGKIVEVIFKAENFKHLTGFESNLTPRAFYNDCVRHRLTLNQIKFSNRHPFSLAKKKIFHLINIYSLFSSQCFMQQDITTSTETYKFGSTNLDFSLMLTEDWDDSTKTRRSDMFIVKSLRDKDCFNKSVIVYSVSHIFVKKNNEKKYGTMLYCDNYEYLPNDIMMKLDEKLKEKLNKIPSLQ